MRRAFSPRNCATPSHHSPLNRLSVERHGVSNCKKYGSDNRQNRCRKSHIEGIDGGPYAGVDHGFFRFQKDTFAGVNRSAARRFEYAYRDAEDGNDSNLAADRSRPAGEKTLRKKSDGPGLSTIPGTPPSDAMDFFRT